MPKEGYFHRKQFSGMCQKLALKMVYPLYFPCDEYNWMEVDEMPGELATRLDIGGVDKLLVSQINGHLVMLGHRFREASVWNNPAYRDFTIRESEWDRHVEAIEKNGTIPSFYGYGYANGTRIRPHEITDFLRFFIMDYKQWLTDVLNNCTRSPYKKDMKGNQENFYWIKWATIPGRYIKFTYPTQQPTLFNL